MYTLETKESSEVSKQKVKDTHVSQSHLSGTTEVPYGFSIRHKTLKSLVIGTSSSSIVIENSMYMEFHPLYFWNWCKLVSDNRPVVVVCDWSCASKSGIIGPENGDHCLAGPYYVFVYSLRLMSQVSRSSVCVQFMSDFRHISQVSQALSMCGYTLDGWMKGGGGRHLALTAHQMS